MPAAIIFSIIPAPRDPGKWDVSADYGNDTFAYGRFTGKNNAIDLVKTVFHPEDWPGHPLRITVDE